jgi:hypothetical protein
MLHETMRDELGAALDRWQAGRPRLLGLVLLLEQVVQRIEQYKYAPAPQTLEEAKLPLLPLDTLERAVGELTAALRTAQHVRQVQ